MAHPAYGSLRLALNLGVCVPLRAAQQAESLSGGLLPAEHWVALPLGATAPRGTWPHPGNVQSLGGLIAVRRSGGLPGRGRCRGSGGVMGNLPVSSIPCGQSGGSAQGHRTLRGPCRLARKEVRPCKHRR